MNLFRLFVSLFYLIIAVGCRNDTVSAPTRTSEVINVSQNYETDLVKLKKFIQLDEEPLRVRWQTFEKGSGDNDLGPSDWGLVGVLEYNNEIIQKMLNQTGAKQIDQELHIEPEFVQAWFPEEIHSSFISVPGSQNVMLNKPRYEPTLFLKPPLQHGYVFISGNWVFLYLQTM